MPQYQKYLLSIDGGLNETTPASMIADNELSDVLNMEYDDFGKSLQTRRGTDYRSTFSGYMTSVFGFRLTGTSDSVNILTQSDSKIIGLNADFQGGNDITNGHGATGYWQWAVMNNVAIGVNGGAPVTATTAIASTGLLAGSPPNSKFIQIWNSRCWLVSSTNKNRLYFSKVGDSTDWSTTGISGAGYIEIGWNDGDDITGIYAFKERLFIFKRNHIYQIITANPNTDNTLWRVELFTKEGGCVSGYTIAAFNDDLIFASDQGVVSLKTVLQWADFKAGIISRKINLGFNGSRDTYSAIVIPDKRQYWIAGEGIGENTGFNTKVYALDLDSNGQYRWLKHRFYTFSWQLPFFQETTYGNIGDWSPTNQQWETIGCFGRAYVGSVPYTMMGTTSVFTAYSPYSAYSGNNYPFLIYPNTATDPTEKYRDSWYSGGYEALVARKIQTKAFAFGDPLQRKLINRLGVGFRNLCDQTVDLNVQYTFDENPERSGAQTQRFLALPEHQNSWNKMGGFQSKAGRRGNTVMLTLSNVQARGFAIKYMELEAALLGSRRSATAGVNTYQGDVLTWR